MTDQKITQFSADASPTLDDLLTTVNDPTGTPANRKVTLANLIKLLSQHLTLENQNISSNVQIADQKMQRGWNFITGTNPWSTKSKTITLPVAYDDDDYEVVVSILGFNAGDPTQRSDVSPADNIYGYQVHIIDNTQFTVTIIAKDAEANTNRLAFAWVAVGTKS